MIEEKYQELLNIPSDINEHFPLIRETVQKGDKIVELGVRNCVSTWALLAGGPANLVSVDVVSPPLKNLREVEEAAKEQGIDFKFIKADSTKIRTSKIDVLFIDTLHLYSHVVKELWRHAENVEKHIIFHDSNIPEVRSCIQDFLYNLHWKFKDESPSGSGLIVLERVSRV